MKLAMMTEKGMRFGNKRTIDMNELNENRNTYGE